MKEINIYSDEVQLQVIIDILLVLKPFSPVKLENATEFS